MIKIETIIEFLNYKFAARFWSYVASHVLFQTVCHHIWKNSANLTKEAIKY